MRRSFICLILLQVLYGTTNTTTAGVLEQDWQSPGDGLLTYDDINNRQWLDLSVTILDQFPGTSREDKYQHVVTETLSGGQFEGFSIANINDVTALAESAEIDTSTHDFSINSTATNNLINLLGETLSSSASGRRFSIGYLDELPPGSEKGRIASLLDYNPPLPINLPDAGLYFSSISDAATSANSGVMLYRETIPEPSAITLVYIALAATISIHRNRSFIDLRWPILPASQIQVSEFKKRMNLGNAT